MATILSDISKLRLEMKILQAKIKGLYRKGCSCAEIAEKLDVPEKSIRVIVKWLTKKGLINNFKNDHKLHKNICTRM